MKISARNFRCFRLLEEIEIRPITILVGENSSGKTSFLALARYLFEVADPSLDPSFNRDPFFLGAFDNIAHYRGGRAGRAKSISLSVSVPEASRHPRSRQLPLFAQEQPNKDIRINLQLSKHLTNVELSQIEVSTEYGIIQVEFRDPRKVVVQLGGGEKITLSQETLPFPIRSTRNRWFALYYITSEFENLIVPHTRKELGHVDLRDLRRMQTSIRRALQALRRDVFAAAPVRTKPLRTYSPSELSTSSEGQHVPQVLAETKLFHHERWESLKNSLDKFGKASGLFNNITVHQMGHSEADPFRLEVKFEGPYRNIADVGYGVSQALPLITEGLHRRNTMFLFQQPEVHLHPRAQAELGSLLCEMHATRRHSFIVETHSDYIINRILTEARNGKSIDMDDVSLLYFHRDELDVSVTRIKFDKLGNILNPPKGYRDFFVEEEMKTLGLN